MAISEGRVKHNPSVGIPAWFWPILY